MEIPVSGGKIVYSMGQSGFEEVVKSFERAKWINIVTFDVYFYHNKGLEELYKISPACKLRIVTNIPHKPGEEVSRQSLDLYLRNLKPERFNNNTSVYFNLNNHSKIIMTNEIAYVGSANFSSSSFHEFGFVCDDPVAIKQLDWFVKQLCDGSMGYYSNKIQNSIDALTSLGQIDSQVLRGLLVLSEKADAAREQRSEHYDKSIGIPGVIDLADVVQEDRVEIDNIRNYLYTLDMNQIKMIHYAIYLAKEYFVQDFEDGESDSIPVMFDDYEGISGWNDRHIEIDHIMNKTAALSRYMKKALMILDMIQGA